MAPNHREWICTQLKITSILPLSSLFILLKCNVNVIVEGSCDMQRILIFVVQFANLLCVDIVNILLLLLNYHRHEIWQLLQVNLLFL